MFWLPIIGPIIQGLMSSVTSIFNKKTDEQIEEVKAATQVIHDTQDDIGVRLSRDIILFPTSTYTAIYVWDKIVAIHTPWLVWGVAPMDGAFTGLPYATIAFLLGWAWMKRNG